MPVGGGGDKSSQQMFGVPATPQMFGGEPVQKFRVRRGVPLIAEFFTRFHQPDPEQFLPQSVHSDPCGEWIFGIDNPTGKRQAIQPRVRCHDSG